MVEELVFIRECFFEVLIIYEFVLDVDSEFQKIILILKKFFLIFKCDEFEFEFFKYFKRYICEIEDIKMLCMLFWFIIVSDLMLYNFEGKFFII